MPAVIDSSIVPSRVILIASGVQASGPRDNRPRGSKAAVPDVYPLGRRRDPRRSYRNDALENSRTICGIPRELLIRVGCMFCYPTYRLRQRTNFVTRLTLWNSLSNRTSDGRSVPYGILGSRVTEYHQRLSLGSPITAPPPHSTRHGIFAYSSLPASVTDGGRS